MKRVMVMRHIVNLKSKEPLPFNYKLIAENNFAVQNWISLIHWTCHSRGLAYNWKEVHAPGILALLYTLNTQKRNHVKLIHLAKSMVYSFWRTLRGHWRGNRYAIVTSCHLKSNARLAKFILNEIDFWSLRLILKKDVIYIWMFLLKHNYSSKARYKIIIQHTSWQKSTQSILDTSIPWPQTKPYKHFPITFIWNHHN